MLGSGWYVTEFMLSGALKSTPRIVVKTDDGKLVDRELVGAHSGRNRMLIYLPQGRLSAHSESIQFELLARLPSWEGRARVLLICWRYLLDFFSPFVLLRMFTMQFKNPFRLSTDLLEFYSPPERTILAALEWWQRRPQRAKLMAWCLRSIKIAVIIEQADQRQALTDLLIVPDAIVLAGSGGIDEDVDYCIPLQKTERLRKASMLLLKLAVWRARRAGKAPQLVYSDHDYAANGSSPQQPEPVFKPNASLAYLHCFNYIGPAVIFARDSLDGLSGKQFLNEEAQYELALSIFNDSERVLHISELLFTSSRITPPATPNPLKSDSSWGNIRWVREDNYNRLIASPDQTQQATVDLIIPTRDGLEFLQPCVEGILERTDYKSFHIYIVDNGSEKLATKNWLQEQNSKPNVSVIDYPGEFNFSAINNAAVAQGNGEYVALINNDIEVIHPDWLSQMMAWVEQPSVGIVGAKLLFGNGLVQHAGVTIGMGNAAGHIHRLEPGDAPGYQHRCLATQNMMAVTAACFITPRALYESLGGLNEKDFKVAYNDIDYCLRVEKRGYDIIWTPEARLYHHESVSRGDDMSERHIKRYFKELTALQKKWKTKGFVDKYYNKHLRISDEGVYPQIDVVGDDPLIEL